MKIEIPYNGNIENILAYGAQQSKDFKGQFEGNKKNGNFEFESIAGKFKGRYEVNKNLIEIYFDKKPLFLPNAIIKQFLKKHIK